VVSNAVNKHILGEQSARKMGSYRARELILRFDKSTGCRNIFGGNQW
jgi:hypothetical protein